MLDHAHVRELRLHLRAPSQDLLGDRRVRLEAPLVLLGEPAEDYLVAVRDPARPARHGLLHEELVEPGVLDHDVLAAQRPELRVRHEVARPDARAVHDDGRFPGDVLERVKPPDLDLSARPPEPGEQVVEVARHVRDRHVD